MVAKLLISVAVSLLVRAVDTAAYSYTNTYKQMYGLSNGQRLNGHNFNGRGPELPSYAMVMV